MRITSLRLAAWVTEWNLHSKHQQQILDEVSVMKHYLTGNEDPNSGSHDPHKKPRVVVNAYNPNDGGIGDGESDPWDSWTG